MGVTRLADFIAFVRKRAIGGTNMDRGELADRWRDAAEVFKKLQVSEAGAADKPDIKPLPPQLQAHTEQLVKLEHFQKTFSAVPVAFGMVELDKLIVCQQHIMCTSIDKMIRTLLPPLSDADLAGVCDAHLFQQALERHRDAPNHRHHVRDPLGAQLVCALGCR